MIWLITVLTGITCVSILYAGWIEQEYQNRQARLIERGNDAGWKLLCLQSDKHCSECFKPLDACPHGNDDLCIECGRHLDRCDHRSSTRRSHPDPTCHVCGDRDMMFTRFGRVSWWAEEEKWICDSCVSGRDKVPPPTNPFDGPVRFTEDEMSDFVRIRRELNCGDPDHDWKE